MITMIWLVEGRSGSTGRRVPKTGVADAEIVV